MMTPGLIVVLLCLSSPSFWPASTSTEDPSASRDHLVDSATAGVPPTPTLVQASASQQIPLARSGDLSDPLKLGDLTRPLTTFATLLAFCLAGWFVVRQRSTTNAGGKRLRKLVISESHALGNRSFLVVVQYDLERSLIGVTPGKIDYLCALPTDKPFAAMISSDVAP